MVLVIDENRILALELERQPPGSADAYRPMILQLPGQGMKSPPRSIHIARPAGIVESKQLQAQLARVLRLNPRLRPGAEEPLHAPMPEAFGF